MFQISKDDTKLILDSFKEGLSEKDIADMFNLDLKDQFCKDLLAGLKEQSKNIDIPDKNTDISKANGRIEWSKEEEFKLKKYYYMELSNKEIAKKFNVSESDISSKFKQMGIHKRQSFSEKDKGIQCLRVFGLNLAIKRIHKNLSLVEVDEKLGFPKGTVSGYERGRWYPPYDKFVKICKLYDIKNPEKLFMDQNVYKDKYEKNAEHKESIENEKGNESMDTIKLKDNAIAVANKTKEEKNPEEIPFARPVDTVVKVQLHNTITEDNIKKLERIAERNGISVPLLLNLVISQLKEDAEIKLVGLF